MSALVSVYFVQQATICFFDQKVIARMIVFNKHSLCCVQEYKSILQICQLIKQATKCIQFQPNLHIECVIYMQKSKGKWPSLERPCFLD